MQLQRRPDLLWERLGDSVALLDKQRSSAHSLDGPAAGVWLACDRPFDRDDLVALVVTQGFDAHEVETSIDSLLHLGVLVSNGAIDRRAVLRRGLGAVAVGAVLSIALPEPAAALSTGAPAPQLRDKPGWWLTGTLTSGVVTSLDSANTAVDAQWAIVSIPAQPDIATLTWQSNYDPGSGLYVFPQFVIADEAGFMFADPSTELSAWLAATEVLAVFYDFQATPQVVGWAYFPSRV